MFAKDFRAQARAALKGKWGQIIGIVVVYALLTTAINAIPTIGSIAALLIAGPLTVGLVMIFINLINAQETKLENLFNYFKHFGNTTILYITNNIFIALWSLLLVVPGIIKTYSYSMSYYIMAENPEMSASDARKASIAMMNGNKWRLFCLQFSFFGWLLLSGILLGIPLLWVYPYMRAAEAAFYQSLKAVPVVEEPVAAE